VLEGFTDEAMGCLEAYRWPGNVRELENVVERAVVLARAGVIEAGNLPPNVTERAVTFTRPEPSSATGASPDGIFTIRMGTTLDEIEHRVLEETLRFAKGNRTVTAKLLGVDPKTIYRKLKQGEAEESASESSES
jgi:two-component system response regulator HydG